METSGNIFIIEAEDNFKRVHKSIIENKNIDCETLGIYTRIIVLGLKWKLNIKGLSTHLDISDSRIRRSIALLEQEGYVVRTAVRGEGGKFYGWNYQIMPTPIEESKRSSAGKPTSQKTDTRLNGQDGEPTTRLTDNTVNGGDNKNKPKESIDLNKDKNKNKSFDFKRALLDLGIEENIVNDWLLVRKQKKATNTETAFKRIKNEIALSGISANECITLAVERCWMGFKAEWVKNAASSYKSQNNSLFSQQPNIIELHPALKQIDENGTLNDGTYLKNGFRYYFSKTSLSAISIPPKAEPKPQGDNFEYDYKLGWYECE